MEDLRDWLAQVDNMGQLANIQGADWDSEVGCLTALNASTPDCPALLFDAVKDYSRGLRVLTCVLTTPGRMALTLNLPVGHSSRELVELLREKLPTWEDNLAAFSPDMVRSGPILQNVDSGNKVNLLKFPVPKWHEMDGGRYVGTGCAVITQDPDSGELNMGTYRMMVHDKASAGLFIAPGHRGRAHYEKYHAKQKACPVAVSVGHDPLMFAVAASDLLHEPYSEYHFAGAIRGSPVKVIREEVTGLPIPASAEMVLVGWCPPGTTKTEGPFGEYTGYYASGAQPAPVMDIERIYYRNDPIMLGAVPGRPPTDYVNYLNLVRSAILHNKLSRNGVPDIKGVWLHDVGQQAWITIAIKQVFPEHAKQAAAIALQSFPTSAKYVIVVDDDIDPTNINDVIWALCTRSDPVQDVDIVRGVRGSPLDPLNHRADRVFLSSRAVINACKPYEWANEFPPVVDESPELVKRVRQKWGGVVKLSEKDASEPLDAGQNVGRK